MKKEYMEPIEIEEDKNEFKSKTTSAIHESENIYNPNVENLLKGVAIILHSQININNDKEGEEEKNENFLLFSETKYIKEKPGAFDQKTIDLIYKPPEENEIYEFVKALYDIAQFRLHKIVLNAV